MREITVHDVFEAFERAKKAFDRNRTRELRRIQEEYTDNKLEEIENGKH